MLRRLAGPIALCLGLGTALPLHASKGTFWECTMPDYTSGKGWISPTIGLILPGDGTAQVVDALVLSHYNKPIRARLQRDNARRLIVKWSLENIKATNGTSFPNFDYRISVNKGTGRADLEAIPRQYDYGLLSTGTCKIRTDRKL